MRIRSDKVSSDQTEAIEKDTLTVLERARLEMPISTSGRNTNPTPEYSEDQRGPEFELAKVSRDEESLESSKRDSSSQNAKQTASPSTQPPTPRPFVFDMFKNYTKKRDLCDRAPPLVNSYLKPNARYVGEQQSSKTRHQIRVEFKTVDLVNSMMTGFLQITGLTDDNPEITTCFKGEIINNPLLHSRWTSSTNVASLEKVLRKFSFFTENNQWHSNPDNDLVHWSKLTGLDYLSDEELLETLQREQEHPDQHIYMRWKEEFLLPDSRVKRIPHASFEGFYYVVLTIKGPEAGSVRGLYYYHKDPEKFQLLNMKFVEDQGHSSLFEFV